MSNWFGIHTWARILLLSAVVGAVGGLGAVAFSFLMEKADNFGMVRTVGFVMPQAGAEGGTAGWHWPTRRWLLPIVPAVGGLLAGVLVFWFAPEAEGHGTDAVVDAFHRRRGVIRKRVPFVKTFASVLTIGSGGSAGREGPIGQIGAGFGSAMASWLGASDRERRLLMLAGAAAGIGAIFRAPLGASLFVAEVLYRDMEFESAALIPGFIASIIAYSLYCGVEGAWGPIFAVPTLQFNHPAELPMYALLAVVCAAVGWLYVRVFQSTRNVFHKIPIPNHIKPALGGLLVGVIGLWLPQAMGMGYGWVQLGIEGHLGLGIAIILVFAKIVTTSLTIGSGGSGGVFAPSLVVGGCLGAVAGIALHRLMPHVVTQPAAFVLVGMAGFFAGVAKAPVASLVMVSEMTTGYGLLVPLMLTTFLAYLLVPRAVTLYEMAVTSRADSPAHEGEFMRDLLEQIHVKDALLAAPQLIVFRRGTPLSEVLAAAVATRQPIFPVLRDEDDALFGVIDFQDIRLFLTEQMAAGLMIAGDLCTHSFGTLDADEDLASALKKLQATTLDGLPVMNGHTPTDGQHATNGYPITGAQPHHNVIGVLSRRNIVAAYHDKMYQTGALPGT